MAGHWRQPKTTMGNMGFSVFPRKLLTLAKPGILQSEVNCSEYFKTFQIVEQILVQCLPQKTVDACQPWDPPIRSQLL